MFRALFVGAIIAATAFAAAPTAGADPAIVASTGTGTGGIAASPPPFLQSPECSYRSKRTGQCVEGVDGAMCADGLYSHSVTSSGTCSRHGGVAQWCPCGGAAPAPSPSSIVPSPLITTGGDNQFVAIAVSPVTGKAGWDTGGSEDEATQKALAACAAATGDVCQMAGGMHHGCAAYAIDPQTNRWHGGAGVDPASAGADAVSRLGGRYVAGVHCSS